MQPDTNGHGVKALTREQILAAIDVKIEAVDVEEWGGTVYIRNLTGKARDAFESSRYRMNGKEVEIIHANVRAALLAASICDSAGVLQFSSKDIDALGEKNGAVLDRLFDVAQRLSGLRGKDTEERLKNLQTAQSDNSGT
jgi:hypothetical protein